jgi:hypothetical protein
MPADKYMTLPPAGTVITTHYDTMHRGSPRLPGDLSVARRRAAAAPDAPADGLRRRHLNPRVLFCQVTC